MNSSTVEVLHPLAPYLHRLGKGRGTLNKLPEWALQPFIILVKSFFRLGRKVLAKKQARETL
jgi:hypothetical protein